jgi:hypothetical protein
MENDKKYVDEQIKSFLFKNKKKENDSFNQIREKMIEIFLKYFNQEIIFTNPSSNDLYRNFIKTLNDFGVCKIQEIKHIGGRSNKDFHIKYFNSDNQIVEMDLEFKSGTLSIEKLPQFLQLYTSNRSVQFFDNSYHEFFYKNYLKSSSRETLGRWTQSGSKSDLTDDIQITIPSYEEYLRTLNFTSKDTFQSRLYEIYKQNKICFNKIVKKSIAEYLEKEIDTKNLRIESINKKLSEQKNKFYLLTHNGEFKLDEIQKYMKVLRVKGIKNKNTLILETENDGELHCLLRWKNGNGCRGPAWQISFKL